MPSAHAVIFAALNKRFCDCRLIAVIGCNPLPLKCKREKIPELIFTEPMFLFVLQMEKNITRVIAKKKLYGTPQIAIELQGERRHDIAAMDDKAYFARYKERDRLLDARGLVMGVRKNADDHIG